jgi:SAM-dependent methyltransferase
MSQSESQSTSVPQAAGNLPTLNNLVLSEDGVYLRANAASFDYSDGEDIERKLALILSEAQDLSSSSAELEAKICDWPTEYHLSTTRANLLRPFNLTGVKRVLELGCGCGAISRYLGEQLGVTVDAVEGSPIRAQLAAQRCRDLPNVRISSANFNEIEFPENHYDLVLFVGVTEYAGRFSTRKTDQEALQDLLALAKKACVDSGTVVIAIENRLGLKYLMGACEDHYGIPDIGLKDYPDSSGIRTYSRSQWQEEIAKSGFAAQRYIYPFPDYKVPTLMINEQASDRKKISDCLEEVHSLDYLQPFSMGERESILWQQCAANNLLGEVSNSFLILLSDSLEALNQLAGFTVERFNHARYDWHVEESLTPITETASPQASTKQAANIARLQSRVGQVEEEKEQLLARLALLEASRGQRFLSLFRRLVGK